MKLALLLSVLFTGTVSLAQTSADREDTLLIGGIKQYITIKTWDTTLPLLLFLHGGPGGSVMGYAEKFTHKLQEHFLVVQWDQRETGRTLDLNASPVPLTVSLFQADTHELIRILLTKFKREKIYLAAHSWGTALGFHIARKYPELLYAYMPIGPMINQLESEKIILGMMKEKAARDGNAVMMKELASVNIPFENGEQLFYHRKWLADFSGSRKKLSKQYVLNWSATWLAVFNDASKDNLMLSLPAIGCPVYFFAGRNDYQTNSSITQRYFTQLNAPRKALYWFEDSGHSIPSSAPDHMQAVIIDKILPETFTIPKAVPVIGQSILDEQ
jgi:pimeloyl-ACP methyl ester carboxylesterase